MEFAEPDSLNKGLMLRERFRKDFLDIVISMHKLGLVPGEVAGKSSNVSSAFRLLVQMTNGQRKDDDSGDITPSTSERLLWIQSFYNRGIITVTDADSMFQQHYFLELSLKVIETTDATRYTKIWQAPVSSYANFYRLPSIVRLTTLGALTDMATMACPWDEKLPYSTYSLSTQLALKAEGWAVDIIAEDWHCFARCFFATGGQTSVEMLATPVINYAVEDEESAIKTVKEKYDQAVRHQWGVIEIAFVFASYLQIRAKGLNFNTYRFIRIISKMISIHFTNFQFFVGVATGLLFSRHLTTVENMSLPFFIMYRILQFFGTQMAVMGILLMLAHFRYERMLLKIWNVDKKTSTQNRQDNFLEYIPILASINLFNRLKFMAEFMLLGFAVSILYQGLPTLHTLTKLTRSPYFTYRVAAKPKLRLS